MTTITRPPGPAAEAAETSGATTSLVLHHVERRGGADALDRLLAHAQVPHTLAELRDPARWVSYATRVRLFEAAAVVLDDPGCTRAMGADALQANVHHPLVLLARALGSPAGVYRLMPRAVGRLSTTAEMEVLESGPTSATLRYRLHDGYPHSRLDCLFTQGLLSVVPSIFGLPPAVVGHAECRSEGDDACRYHVTWSKRRRLPWRRTLAPTESDRELVALRGQLADLQSAATELVRTDDLTGLLHRITDRAAAAVLAPGYLLALHDADGGEPVVHSRGIAPAEAAALARRLLAGEDLDDRAVVVDVASSRRVHGKLAALHGRGRRGYEEERRLLGAYAGHAAAALDLMTAVELSRRGEGRSAALLSLAHDLRSATEPAVVARVVTDAVVRIVGCDASTVFSWDERAGRLHAMASAGLTAAQTDLLDATVIQPHNSPELTALLTRQEPSLLRPGTTAPTVHLLMGSLGLSDVMVMPLLAGGGLIGVATAAWRTGSTITCVEEALSRLTGVAEFTATALENARLLGTVRHQSLHDALTQLPNRVLFNQGLDRALQRPDARGRVALLFCDLDRFKQVNDGLGHAAGDELLRQAAGRLTAAVRPGDLVARLSGDEFAVLLEGLDSTQAADEVAHRVVARLAAPFRVDGLELRITTSVGVAVHDGQQAGGDALLRAADGAMYAAKQRGRNQVAHAGRVVGAPERPAHGPTLESDLRSAAERGQLRLHFQRLVDITDSAGTGGGQGSDDGVRTVGVEALLRWQHPELGLLPPGAFLSLAEETDLVVDLDLWAVGEACRALAHWPAEDGAQPLHVAVNTSARTLVDARLQHTVLEALRASDLDPHRLCLEVVESRSLVDLPGVADRLTALRQLGVRISLDDFGTGYSTLSWLQRLPVDQIKLDRSFTGAISDDAKSLALARGVLALSRELGVEVVVEGVECPQQLAILRAAGFSLAQGYLWGMPRPAPEPRA